jgi:RNA polymerase sigma-70 factor (ECF subfamily)
MNTTTNSHHEFRLTSEDGLRIACSRRQSLRRGARSDVFVPALTRKPDFQTADLYASAAVHGPAPNNAAAVSDLRAWSEEQLIAAAKSGGRAPFGELCERHVTRVFRVTHRILRNREDAEDAAQDCFLNAFVHLHSFDGRSQFVTWLTRIAINAALAKLRKKRGIREVPMDEPRPSGELGAPREIQDNSPDPEETYRLRERRQIVNATISELRPRAREVVELHQLQEHSVRETAQILGISIAAVKARMFHARAALHRMPLLKNVAGQIGRALVE